MFAETSGSDGFSEKKYGKHKKNNEEELDDDLVELPPDTLAILNEFLLNKDNQKSLECEDMFEEDWV